MIYLDNAATTKVFDCAIDAAIQSMRENYFNPNATYCGGVAVKRNIESHREAIAREIGAVGGRLYFTSGATEANNWAINFGRKNKKGNIVITAGEHSSVYEPAMRLKNGGTDVRIAKLSSDGTVDVNDIMRLVDIETALVSVIHTNNETGVVNPIAKITADIKSIAPRAFIHSDGVQAVLKTGDTIDGLGVDFYTVGGHKLGAPKGIGLLYVRNGVNISPMLAGGGQEYAMRSGTQNTPYIAAFAAAVQEFNRIANRNEILSLREKLVKIFEDNGCGIIGSGENSGYILCVHIPEVKAEILQNLAYDNGVVIGKGAACSGNKRGNRVLEAMGLSRTVAEQCIRISLCAGISDREAVEAAHIIVECANSIRSNHIG